MRRTCFAVASSAVLGAALLASASGASAQTPVLPSAQVAAASQGGVAVTAGVRDPYERTNRKIYQFNRDLDRNLLRPPTVFYHHAVTRRVRGGVHNMLRNMTGPIIFVNDVLQLHPVDAGRTALRFFVNSTIGIGGMVEIGERAGIPYHNADFGETMARYGVPAGPYLFVPVLGPSTVRDLGGRVFDSFADPLNVVRYDGRVELGISRTGAGGLDARDGAEPVLKSIDRTATDPYVTIRSLYLQSRDAEIRGAPVTQQSVDALPDIGPAPAPPPPPPPPAPRAEASPPTPPAATAEERPAETTAAAAPASTF